MRQKNFVLKRMRHKNFVRKKRKVEKHFVPRERKKGRGALHPEREREERQNGTSN